MSNLPPTIQQLSRPLKLKNLEILALRYAAGISRTYVRSPKVWKRLLDLQLITPDRKITLLGKTYL